jgi:hypothetical protein
MDIDYSIGTGADWFVADEKGSDGNFVREVEEFDEILEF